MLGLGGVVLADKDDVREHEPPVLRDVLAVVVHLRQVGNTPGEGEQSEVREVSLGRPPVVSLIIKSSICLGQQIRLLL